MTQKINQLELPLSGVTPGTYTNATFTVDETGRITSVTLATNIDVTQISDQAGNLKITFPVGQGTANCNGLWTFPNGIVAAVIESLDGESAISLSSGQVTASVVNVTTGLKMPGGAFMAYCSTSKTAVTGDGSYGAIIFDTALSNSNNIYNVSTGIFTALRAGLYSFAAYVQANSLSSTHTSGYLRLKVNATYNGIYADSKNPYATRRSDGPCGFVLPSTIVQLNAGDQVSLQLFISSGTKTVSIDGGVAATVGGAISWFSGAYVSSS